MRLRVAISGGALLLGSACSSEPAEAPPGNQVSPHVTADAASGAQPPGTAPLDASDLPAADAGGTNTTSMDATTAAPAVGSDAATVDASAAPIGDASVGADAAAGEAGSSAGMSCLKGEGDYTKAGPYKFKQKNVTIGAKGQYTIVYPDPLEAACPHPFVVWGNGTFITGGTAYTPFQEHAASYGMITIASHSSSVGDGSFHTAAIDYMLAENKRMGGEFFGKLSERAGVSGHSQGGAGADRGATMHKSVKAIANVQGSFGTPPMSDAAFLCLTGTEDIQPTGCPDGGHGGEGARAVRELRGRRSRLHHARRRHRHGSVQAPVRGLVPLLPRGRPERLRHVQGRHGLPRVQGARLGPDLRQELLRRTRGSSRSVPGGHLV